MKIIQRILCLLLLFPSARAAAQTFRIATFNVENYIEEPVARRPLKSEEARAAVCHAIATLKPDVIALEEMGSSNSLMELQASVKSAGLDLPYWDLISGSDPSIHLALLSRLPIVARHPQTNDSFILDGRRFYVSRGFLDEEIQVTPRFKFTLIAAHLKSKLATTSADEEEMREQEAILLRRLIDAQLAAEPSTPLVVLGDFNDTKDSRALKTILGKPPTALFDTRPAEPSGVSWTEYFSKEDVYSRIDYILVNHALQNDLMPQDTYILSLPNWFTASDHRPLVATFAAP